MFCFCSYRWIKNGNSFPLDADGLSHRVTRTPGEASIVLTNLRVEDKGTYQCIADNGNGTAFDHPIELKHSCNYTLLFCGINKSSDWILLQFVP